MQKLPKTKADFILELTEAIKGELLTHLDYKNDKVQDIMDSMMHIKHMCYEIVGSLTKDVLK